LTCISCHGQSFGKANVNSTADLPYNQVTAAVSRGTIGGKALICKGIKCKTCQTLLANVAPRRRASLSCSCTHPHAALQPAHGADLRALD
jgi:hypothetical protein